MVSFRFPPHEVIITQSKEMRAYHPSRLFPCLVIWLTLANLLKLYLCASAFVCWLAICCPLFTIMVYSFPTAGGHADSVNSFQLSFCCSVHSHSFFIFLIILLKMLLWINLWKNWKRYHTFESRIRCKRRRIDRNNLERQPWTLFWENTVSSEQILNGFCGVGVFLWHCPSSVFFSLRRQNKSQFTQKRHEGCPPPAVREMRDSCGNVTCVAAKDRM